MSVLNWLQHNRLKMVSILAVAADCLMGMAGGVSIFFWHNATHLSDACLIIASLFSLTGHAALLVWGKGGENESKGLSAGITHTKLWERTLPWYYPLDFGFFNFVVAGFIYALAGVIAQNFPLFLQGLFVAAASALGWLWPHNKPIFGLNVLQVTAMIYTVGTFSTFWAGWVFRNGFIVAAACFYLALNAILYTVRKHNQSDHAQAQSGGHL